MTSTGLNLSLNRLFDLFCNSYNDGIKFFSKLREKEINNIDPLSI